MALLFSGRLMFRLLLPAAAVVAVVVGGNGARCDGAAGGNSFLPTGE